MLRIKEAIQRRRLIHEMHNEWKDLEKDIEFAPFKHLALSAAFTAGIHRKSDQEKENGSSSKSDDSTIRRATHKRDLPATSPEQQQASGCPFSHDRAYSLGENPLNKFVQYLASKLSDYQKRALKVTWRRLSEAPKTSGRGTIHIMERVLNMLCEKEPSINVIFYKSAFLSCLEDRRCGRVRSRSIATIRDHAHILVEFINAMLQFMFEGDCPATRNLSFDPASIGQCHSKLIPLGFERRIWLVLGECFAEVMFNQECIRAYPHAPSAWSLLAVTMTDQMYAASKPTIFTSAPYNMKSCSSLEVPSNLIKEEVEDLKVLSNEDLKNAETLQDLPLESRMNVYQNINPRTLPQMTNPMACRQAQLKLANSDEELKPRFLPKTPDSQNAIIKNNDGTIKKFLRSKSESRVKIKNQKGYKNL